MDYIEAISREDKTNVHFSFVFQQFEVTLIQYTINVLIHRCSIP